ncbi:hypothetical protein F5B20DRAFT_583399 [Whalleya microplaca]|nr:hypothetical protein F5B20DRAFT_583399 [Whalleya microplaca]
MASPDTSGSANLTANLTLRSRADHAVAERHLFYPHLKRSRAVYWACVHGELDTLQFALRYGAGASPSVVEVQRRTPRTWDRALGMWMPTTEPAKMSTLHVAAKRGNVQTFAFLLAQGARVDDPGLKPKQIRGFMRCLCKPGRSTLLERFLGAGGAEQAKKYSQDELSIALVSAILKPDTPLHTIQLLLDHGADPNHAHRKGRRVTLSPLSAAVRSQTAEIFDLLIASGARISGPRIPRATRTTAGHVPVIAAVRLLPDRGPRMLALCIAHGGDVNRATPVRVGEAKTAWVTPLLAYLDGIADWTSETTAACGATEGLRWLLDQHVSTSHMTTEDSGGASVEGPPVLELLLAKWGLAPLREREYRGVLRLLVQQRAFLPCVGTVLAQYGWPYTAPAGIETDAVVVSAWTGLVKAMCARHPGAADKYLWSAVTTVGMTWRRGPRLVTATLDALLEAGGDINAPGGGEGRPGLHELCIRYNLAAREARLAAGPFFEYFNRGWPKDYFFAYLVAKGADPKIRVRGWSANDILTWRLRADAR